MSSSLPTRCARAYLLAAALAVSALGQEPADPAPPARPNVLVILVDDVGYGDVGAFGGDLPTPHVDRLAAQGVRLDAFYATQLCTPSRAALLTGRYPLRYGLQHRVVQPDSTEGLPPEERTLAEALQARGYRTAICGKWHLGHARAELRPLAQGFDAQYGSWLAAVDYFDRTNRNRPAWYRDEEPLVEEGYTTDLIASEAIRHLAARAAERDAAAAARERAGNGAGRELEAGSPAPAELPDRPLFLYVAFTAAHRPLQAPIEEILRHREIHDPGRKRFAAVVSLLDAGVGRIVDALEDLDLARDTLVVFASDNGAVKDGSNGPLRGDKGKLYEGGVRVPAIARWSGVLPAGVAVAEPLHLVDVFPTVLALAGPPRPDLGTALAEVEAAAPPLDGRDAWATLARGAPSPHAEIVINVLPDTGALRRGRYKLLAQWEDETELELYDLVLDPHERRDLSAELPEVTAELAARLEHWRALAAPSVHADRAGR